MLRTFTHRTIAMVAGLLLLASAPALAKEESKIKLRLDNVATGTDARARGWARVMLDANRTLLHIKVRRLQPSTEYIVTFNGVEFDRFTTAGNGHANVKFDLMGDGATVLPTDPRGQLLAINDGTEDVLAGVVSGPMEPRWIIAKEWTDLEPEAAVTGRAFARFRRNPNGLMIFVVGLRHLTPRTDYDVLLDGALLGTISTNGAGNGALRFKGRPSGAKGGPKFNPRRKWQPLPEDPRYRLIEVLEGGTTLVFSGPMEAQIAGLNDCVADLTEVAMTGASGSGAVRHGVGDDCDDVVEVEVAGLAEGDYDLQVNSVSVATLAVAADGTGSLVFESDPESGEELLDFTLQSGDVVDVVDTVATSVVLSATLP